MKWVELLCLMALTILSACRSTGEALADAQRMRAEGRAQEAIRFYIEAIKLDKYSEPTKQNLFYYIRGLMVEQKDRYHVSMRDGQPYQALENLDLAVKHKLQAQAFIETKSFLPEEEPLRNKAHATIRVLLFKEAELKRGGKDWNSALDRLAQVSRHRPSVQDMDEVKRLNHLYKEEAYTHYWLLAEMEIVQKAWFKGEKLLIQASRYRDQASEKFKERQVEVRSAIFGVHSETLRKNLSDKNWDQATSSLALAKSYADFDTERKSLTPLQIDLKVGLFNRSLARADEAVQKKEWAKALQTIAKAEPVTEVNKSMVLDRRNEYEALALRHCLQNVDYHLGRHDFAKATQEFKVFDSVKPLLSKDRQRELSIRFQDMRLAEVNSLSDKGRHRHAYLLASRYFKDDAQFLRMSDLKRQLRPLSFEKTLIMPVVCEKKYQTVASATLDVMYSSSTNSLDFVRLLSREELNSSLHWSRAKHYTSLSRQEAIRVATEAGASLVIIPEWSRLSIGTRNSSDRNVYLKKKDGTSVKARRVKGQYQLSGYIEFWVVDVKSQREILSVREKVTGNSAFVRLDLPVASSELILNAGELELSQRKMTNQDLAEIYRDLLNDTRAKFQSHCLSRIESKLP